MINYIEFLNVPAKIAIVLVGLFLVIQVIGELLEFKGKVVPEFAKIRKVFARRKKERMLLQKMEKTIDQVQLTLDDLNQHYSTDNIRMRDEWMRLVNSKLDQYDKSISELGVKLDKNNSDTLSILIDSKRNAIISFASLVIDESKPVTREQFNRIFKVHQEYESIIELGDAYPYYLNNTVIQKMDGSYWVCGENVGSEEKVISGAEGDYSVVCDYEFCLCDM